MIDPNRRARPLIVAVAALAVVIAASGAVAAQSPSPVSSAAPAVPSAAPSAEPVAKIPVALLLADTTDPRWEDVDRPAFAAKLTEVCPTAVLDARNAGGDAVVQTQQAQEALAAGAKVLVLDPVDAATGAAVVTSAQAAGAKVISYDTPVTGAAPDYHIAYDPAAVGTVVAGTVLTSNSEANAAASPAPTVAPAGVRVVLIEGPAADPNAAAWTTKVKDAFTAEATIVHQEAVTALTAEEGQRVITAAIAALGADGFDAVISSDDAVAGGIIAGLTGASIDPATRLVTGGDATVSGVQQVLLGTQLLTTFAPPTAQAQLAAVVACGLATGTGLPEGLTTTPVSNGTTDVPTLFLTGIAVTVDGSVAGTRSVADTIIADTAFGADTAALICTGDVLAACTDNDISLPSASPSPAASAGSSAAPSAAPSATPAASPAAASPAAASPAASEGPVPSTAPSTQATVAP